MNAKKRGLGKGLSDLGLGALLGDLASPPTLIDELPSGQVHPHDGELRKLPVETLNPGRFQPRKHIDSEALEALADSIRTQGVIQPIVVRESDDHRYEIIAGERRWRAAKLVGLKEIPAIIREISDDTAMVVALIENIQRRDLNIIEEAHALDRLISEFSMTHQQVAESIGKSRAAVTNTLRLLKLPQAVHAFIAEGKLEMGHARALLALTETQQFPVAEAIIAKQLSVRETEDFIRDGAALSISSDNDYAEKPRQKKIVMYEAQTRLSQKFQLPVSVIQTQKGAGKIVIRYKSNEELENLLMS